VVDGKLKGMNMRTTTPITPLIILGLIASTLTVDALAATSYSQKHVCVAQGICRTNKRVVDIAGTASDKSKDVAYGMAAVIATELCQKIGRGDASRAKSKITEIDCSIEIYEVQS
jgi:hypothetical protein